MHSLRILDIQDIQDIGVSSDGAIIAAATLDWAEEALKLIDGRTGMGGMCESCVGISLPSHGG